MERIAKQVTVCLARVEGTGLVQEWISPLELQLAPAPKGFLEQGHVRWMLVVRQTNDSALAVRRPKGVSRLELFDAHDTCSAGSQVRQRRGSHPSQPDHDSVIHAANMDAAAGSRTGYWGRSSQSTLTITQRPFHLATCK